MIKYIFVEKAFKETGTKDISLLHIIENEEFSSNVLLKIVSIKDLKAIYEEEKARPKKTMKFNFEFEQGFFKCDSCPIIDMEPDNLAMLEGLENMIREENEYSIFALFDRIVSDNGRLIPNVKIDDVMQNKVIPYFPYFVPRFSDNTMTVRMSVLDENEGWYTQVILIHENESLVFNPFYFAVRSEDKSNYEKFDVKEICDYDNGVNKYTVFEVNPGIPLTGYANNDIPDFGSLVCRYVYNRELYKILAKSSDFVIKQFKQYLGDPDIAYSNKRTGGKVSYIRPYANYQLHYKKLTGKEYTQIYSNVNRELLEPVKQGTMSLKDIMIYCDKLGCDVLRKYVYSNILELLISDQGGAGILTNARSYFLAYSRRQFKADNVLYRIRLSVLRRGTKILAMNNSSDVPYIAVGGMIKCRK